MAVNTTTINGDVFLPSGAVREKSFVIFEMTGFDTDADDDAVIVPYPIRAPIDETGAIDVDLWPNADGVRSTLYSVTFEIHNGVNPHFVGGGKISVPVSGGPYALNDLLPVTPPAGATVEDYIAYLEAAVAAAEGAADRAEALAPFASRAAAEAATVAGSIMRISVTSPAGDTLWYKRDATGTALTTDGGDNWSPDGEWSAAHFGAALDGTTNDTAAIQSAINSLSSAGGGRLVIDGPAFVSASAETDTFERTNDTPLSVSTGCVVVREGVLLVFRDTGKLISDDPTLSMVFLLDMGTTKSGGIVSETWDWRIENAWSAAGAGHGVYFVVSDLANKNDNVRLSNFGIRNVGSYGVADQYGASDNCQFENIWTFNTGADGFDLKGRSDDALEFRYNQAINCRATKFGQRTGITDSAGIDARGNWQVRGFRALDFAVAGASNVGLRLSSGVYNGDDIRPSSKHTLASDIYINSGDPSESSNKGIVLLSSEGSVISGAAVKNCYLGAVITDASSGVGDVSEDAKITGLTIDGCYGTGLTINSDSVKVSNASIKGAVDEFSEDRGNLAVAQTVLALPRSHDVARLTVTLNGTALVETTDYTVTDAETITLVVGAVSNDKFVVETPPLVGANVAGDNCDLVAVSERNAATKLTLSGEGATITGGNLRPTSGSFQIEVADAQTGGNVATIGDNYSTWTRDGDNVTLFVSINNIDTTGLTGANQVFLRNLPFTVSDLGGRSAEEIYFSNIARLNVTTFIGFVTAEIRVGRDYIRLAETRNNAGVDYVDVQDLTSGNTDIGFQITYKTDAA